MKTFLSFHGVGVEINAPKELSGWVKHDYSYFVSNQDTCDIQFKLVNKKPDYKNIPKAPARVYHTDYIAYDKKHMRYVDYFGEALVTFDKLGRSVVVECADKFFLYEISDLILSSMVGEELDRRGLHRLHALAITFRSMNVILLLPMSGGKTTLGLKLLEDDRVRLISDDTPLITSTGAVLVYPERLGVVEVEGQYKGYVREFKRLRESDRNLLSVEAFKDKIASSTHKDTILISGSRAWADDCRIVKTRKVNVFPRLFSNMVLGLELPQALAYFLKGSLSDWLGKAVMAFSRLIAAISLLSHAQTYSIIMGNNPRRNAETILRFLDNHRL